MIPLRASCPRSQLIIALSWALGALMHWWPRLPARWRRLASIASSAAGLAFLVAGTAAEGLRETATTSMVVLGPAYLTGTASASAQPALLRADRGVPAPRLRRPHRRRAALARWLREHWLLSAVAVAWLVTVIRFLLERSASPPGPDRGGGSHLDGPGSGGLVRHLPPRQRPRDPAPCSAPLVAYAYLVRGFVALVAVRGHPLPARHPLRRLAARPGQRGAERLRLHASQRGSASQIFWLTLVPQLVVWPLFTVAAGLAAGLRAWRWVPQAPVGRHRSPADSSPPRPRLAAAQRTRHCSAPTPPPQRWLPSLKLEQTSPRCSRRRWCRCRTRRRCCSPRREAPGERGCTAGGRAAAPHALFSCRSPLHSSRSGLRQPPLLLRLTSFRAACYLARLGVP